VLDFEENLDFDEEFRLRREIKASAGGLHAAECLGFGVGLGSSGEVRI